MTEIKLNAGDIIHIHPSVLENLDFPIFISDHTPFIEAVIFYDNKLGELAFEAYYFIFPISFLLNQRNRYPLRIIGNAHEDPELLEDNK